MAQDIASTGFSYEALAAAEADEARTDADWIRDRWHRLQGDAVEGMIAIGLRLISARERVGHGNFLPWIAAEFEFSRMTASRMMNAAERFGENVTALLHFTQETVYLLAAPSTPEAIREDILSRPPEDVPSFQELKEMVRTAKAAAAADRPAKPRPPTDQEERRRRRTEKHDADHRARRARDRSVAESIVVMLRESLGDRFEHAAALLATVTTSDLREALAGCREAPPGVVTPEPFDWLPPPGATSKVQH